MEMIERVAGAIAYAVSLQSDSGVSLKGSDFRDEARAAIEAMREPTCGMIQAGNKAGPDEWHDPHPADAWRAMIDAALSNDRVVDRIDIGR